MKLEWLAIPYDLRYYNKSPKLYVKIRPEEYISAFKKSLKCQRSKWTVYDYCFIDDCIIFLIMTFQKYHAIIVKKNNYTESVMQNVGFYGIKYYSIYKIEKVIDLGTNSIKDAKTKLVLGGKKDV